MSDQSIPQENSLFDELSPEAQRTVSHMTREQLATWAVQNGGIPEHWKKAPPVPTLTPAEEQISIACGMGVEAYLAQKVQIETERKAQNERDAANVKAFFDSQPNGKK